MTKVGKSLPPKRYGLPWLYFMLQLGKNPLDHLLAARVRYGDIYWLDLGLKQAIILNHPSHAEHILRTHSTNYVKGGTLPTPLSNIVGDGVVNSTGDLWLEQRRSLQPFFHKKQANALHTLMLTTIERELDGWESMMATPTPLNITQALANIAANVTAQAIFSTTIQPAAVAELSSALTLISNQMLPHLMRNLLPNWLPLPGRLAYDHALQRIQQIMGNLIHQRRQLALPTDDLLAALLDKMDPHAEGAEQLLQDEVISLFVAGYDTTATCLAWTVYLLLRHPAILSKLRAEVDKVIGARRPALADLSQLSYMKMVLYESLRLYPPGWRITRSVVADDEIDGFHIPASSSVLTLIYAIHHHPALWPNPHQFDPERFGSDLSTNRHPFAWLPFGAGPRQCIGRDFALMEIQLILTMLLQRYDMVAMSDRIPKIQFAITLKPKTDLFAHLTKRLTPL